MRDPRLLRRQRRELIASATLSDVFCTGHHCAVTADVGPRTTVTVVGDGAVGLSAVLAAKRLGAERIILMGRHKGRTDLGRDFGATDVVAERGDEGIERVRELTGGHGTHTVLECVGTLPALHMSIGTVRPGGTISRVGAPQYPEVPLGFPEFMKNITLTGGVAPARAYIDELLPDILEGRIEPGRLFDRTVGLDAVPDGYRAMAGFEQLVQARVHGLFGRHGRALRPRSAAGRTCGEIPQMQQLGFLQQQGGGEGVDHRRAGVGLPAAFQPGVVVDAHPGQGGDLLTAQARPVRISSRLTHGPAIREKASHQGPACTWHAHRLGVRG